MGFVLRFFLRVNNYMFTSSYALGGGGCSAVQDVKSFSGSILAL
jgi:hypothetical protein